MAHSRKVSFQAFRDLMRNTAPRSKPASRASTSSNENNGRPPSYSPEEHASAQRNTKPTEVFPSQPQSDTVIDNSDATAAKKTAKKPEITIPGSLHPDYVLGKHYDNPVLVFTQACVRESLSCDEISIHDGSVVSGDVVSLGRALVTGDARVTGHLSVDGNTLINENARVSGNITAHGNAEFCGQVRISGRVIVGKDLTVRGNAIVSGDVFVEGNARIYQNAVITGTLTVIGECSVEGNARVSDPAVPKRTTTSVGTDA